VNVVFATGDADGGALGAVDGVAGTGLPGAAVTTGVAGSAVGPAPTEQPPTRSASRAAATLGMRSAHYHRRVWQDTTNGPATEVSRPFSSPASASSVPIVVDRAGVPRPRQRPDPG